MTSHKFNEMHAFANHISECGIRTVYKKDVHQDITEIAKAIYESEWQQKKRPRTYEEVYNDCKHVVIEHALSNVLGGMRNPKDFNSYDPDSYMWDVAAESPIDYNDVLFECKRHKENGGEFFCYSNSGMKTFLKHKSKLGYVITAKVTEEKDWYTVEFTFIIDAPSFELYWKPSKYQQWESYYNHHQSDYCVKI